MTTTTEAVNASERLIPDDSPESGASFKHRFARLREAVLRFDHRQRLVFANPAAIRLFGLSTWQHGTTIEFVDLFQDPDRALHLVNQLHQLSNLHHEECRLRGVDLSRDIPAMINLLGLYDIEGRLAGFEAYISDLTAQYAAETRLRTSEQRLRTIVDAISDGLLVVTPDEGRIVFVNAAMERMLGYTAAELTAMRVLDLHHPRHRAWVQNDFHRHSQGLTRNSHEVPMQRKDGSLLHVDISSSELVLEGRSCILGVVRDVSDRVRARATEQRSASLMKSAQRIAQLGYWVWDFASSEFQCSPELQRLIGDTDPGAYGYRALLRRIPCTERSALLAALRAVLHGMETEFDLELTLWTCNGGLFTVHTRGEAIRDRRGWFIGLVGTVLDISANVAAQQRLQVSEARFRQIFESSPLGIVTVSADNTLRYLAANSAFCQMLGYDVDSLTQMTVHDVTPPMDIASIVDRFDDLVRGEISSFCIEKRCRRADGAMIWGRVTASLIQDGEESALVVLCLVEDITEKRLIEDRLTRVLTENRWLAQNAIASRECERKYLARELHDELGQLLTAIRLDADLLVQPGFGLEARTAAAADIQEQTRLAQERVRAVTLRLHPLDLELLGLSPTLSREVQQWEQRNPGIRCELKVSGEFDDLDERLLLDLYRIVQESLTNITRYARATEVRIRMTRGEFENEPLERRLRERNGTNEQHNMQNRTGEISLAVYDNGVGIEPERNRPGLGLLGMRERVESHGGRFEVQSASGGGTAILVWIPLGNGSVESPQSP